jgi:23S rRNA (pseudouridine1915-N3)-methyltransferase
MTDDKGPVMRVIVAAVGRLKQGAERELSAAYRKRAEAVGRSAGVRQVEIIEIRESRARDPERRRTEESIAIANVVPEGAVIIVFDQAGENIDSPGLAALLQKCRQDNRAAVCFIIGGADGITQSLRERAKHVLAFGSATWPHQLVRIMLLEQLYRAATILAGHPYHRT